jgi:hypothetical protein
MTVVLPESDVRLSVCHLLVPEVELRAAVVTAADTNRKQWWIDILRFGATYVSYRFLSPVRRSQSAILSVVHDHILSIYVCIHKHSHEHCFWRSLSAGADCEMR